VSTPGMPELGMIPDSDLQKVLDIAAYIGEIGQDEVNVSYTSLLIGLMWSGDPISHWLQKQQKELSVKTEAIYGRRLVNEGVRDRILADVLSGRRAAPRKELYSVSAKTVLQEAVSIAQETKRPLGAPLGARHVAAVYFFRNPPGHNTQFYQEWGFQREAWRQAFAHFVAREYGSELQAWSHVLAGYVASEPADATVSGEVLRGYQFEPESLGLLRALESTVAAHTPSVFYSEDLLVTLAAVRSVPDCAAFADLSGRTPECSDNRRLAHRGRSIRGHCESVHHHTRIQEHPRSVAQFDALHHRNRQHRRPSHHCLHLGSSRLDGKPAPSAVGSEFTAAAQ